MLYLAVKKEEVITNNPSAFLIDGNKQIQKFEDIESAQFHLKNNGFEDFSRIHFQWNFVIYKNNLLTNETHLPLLSVFEDFKKSQYYSMETTTDRRILFYIATLGSFENMTLKSLNKLLSLLEDFEKGKL